MGASSYICAWLRSSSRVAAMRNAQDCDHLPRIATPSASATMTVATDASRPQCRTRWLSRLMSSRKSLACSLTIRSASSKRVRAGFCSGLAGPFLLSGSLMRRRCRWRCKEPLIQINGTDVGRGVQNFTSERGAYRRLSHSRVFFASSTTFRTIERTVTMTDQKSRESDQCLTGDAPRSTAKTPPGASNILQASLPIAQTVACDVCGAPFEILRRRGRPQRFCSDPCRVAQLTAQKRAWSRSNRSRISGAKKTSSTSTGENPNVES
jgi:hypothetical protein